MNSIKILVNSLDNLYPFQNNQVDPDLDQQGEVEDLDTGPDNDNRDHSEGIDHDTNGKGTTKLAFESDQQIDPEIILDQEKVTQLKPNGIIIPDVIEGKQLKSSPASSSKTTKTTKTSSPLSSSSSSSSSTSIAYTILMLLFIAPNYLIIKPLRFILYVIMYPFTYISLSLGLSKSTKVEDDDSSESVPEMMDYDSNINSSDYDIPASNLNSEKLKQQQILSNTIKSPTFSSKYFIPPPQRLYPLSRNPHKKRKKKILILDLDETLIHSLSRGSPRSFNTLAGEPKMIEIKLKNVATLYFVHKRPFCDFFLQQVCQWYELQIFTASVKEYADPIIDWLEQDIIAHYKKKSKNSTNIVEDKVFTKRYYRNDCTYRPGIGYIKDLSKFVTKSDELRNMIIIDNSPVSFALHEDNAIMIEGWINDQSDRDLLHLLPMLHSLSLCIDVRYILGLRSGEKIFET